MECTSKGTINGPTLNMDGRVITKLRILGGIERPLKIYCDNKSTVMYFNNNRSFSK